MLSKSSNSNNFIERYEKYLCSDPDNIVLLTTLGNLYFQSGDSRKALHYFKQCISIDPSNQIARTCLAKIFINIKDYHQAEKTLKSLLDESYHCMSVKHDFALSLYLQKRWSEAFEAFKDADLNYTDNLRYAIYCLHHKYEYGKALNYAKTFPDAEEDNSFQGYLSLLECDSGSATLAKKRAVYVLKKDANDIHANTTLGLWFIQNNQFRLAKRCLSTPVEQGHCYPRAILYLSICAMLTENYALAINHLKKIKTDDESYIQKIFLGWMHIMLYSYDTANYYFLNALEMSPESEEAYAGLAVSWALQDKEEKSRININILKKQWPSNTFISVAEKILQQKSANRYNFLKEAFFILLNNKAIVMDYIKDIVIAKTKGMVYVETEKYKGLPVSSLSASTKQNALTADVAAELLAN